MQANLQVKVAVVGGGITGLCSGTLLREALGSDSVVVLEASETAGGYASTESTDGFLFDCGPNGFLDKEPLMLEWLSALGLGDDLIQANEAAAKRFLFLGDRLVEVAGPPKFLFSPALSLRGKARLFAEPFVKSKRDDSPESIWDFAARRIGKEAADTLVSAMVLGVFGGDAHHLSLEHCFPKMAEMEREHGTLFRAMMARRKQKSGGGPSGPGGVLTSFRDGVGAMASGAKAALGDALLCGTRVTALRKEGAAYALECADGRHVLAEWVIVATPAYHASTLLSPLDEDIGKVLQGINYADIAVVSTAYRRDDVGCDMNGFGFLVPPNQKRDVMGCIWTSSIFPHTAPEGSVLLRTMVGGALDPRALDQCDAELIARIKREVHPVMGIDRSPEGTRIFRHRRGIPQYGLDHRAVLERLDAGEMRNPGLLLAGSAYRGVSMNDCVVSAHRAVNRVMESVDR